MLSKGRDTWLSGEWVSIESDVKPKPFLSAHRCLTDNATAYRASGSAQGFSSVCSVRFFSLDREASIDLSEPCIHLDLQGHCFIRFCEGAYPCYWNSRYIRGPHHFTDASPQPFAKEIMRTSEQGRICLKPRAFSLSTELPAAPRRISPLVSTSPARWPPLCGPPSAWPGSASFRCQAVGHSHFSVDLIRYEQ